MAVLGHVSHTDIHTKNGIVWTAARHRAECHPYFQKSKLRIYFKRRRNSKEKMRKKRSIKYSYMAGSRQHLTCSFMRACLRCLPLVDTDVLLLLYVPVAVVIMVLLLYCGWLRCCCYCCPCARRSWRNIYVEKTRIRVYSTKKV